MKRSLAFCAVLVLALVAATSARSASQSTWYWSTGLCKSELKNYKMQLGSGANAPTLATTAAYCIGHHNRCWLPKNGKRIYKDFTVYVLAKDGAVRTFQLQVTGQNSWSGTPFLLVAKGVTPAQFAAVYGGKASAAAAHDATLGCTDPTG